MYSFPTFFNYHLPEERIAQRPAGQLGPRDSAKLLRAVVKSGNNELTINSQQFSDLAQILKPGDLLVLNNSRVIPCRFFVELEGLSTPAEVFLLGPEEGVSENSSAASGTNALPSCELWTAIARPMKHFRPGLSFALAAEGSDQVQAVVLGRNEDRSKLRLELSRSGSDGSCRDLLDRQGAMPIPPYIRCGRADQLDRELYQTVFAQSAVERNFGSVAAPTAGLHFTEPLLAKLDTAGVEHCFVTLDVGWASISPVKVDNIAEHQMAAENFSISAEVVRKIIAAKSQGRRVVAVGTTSVRALESALSDWSQQPQSVTQQPLAVDTATSKFITPGYQFQVVDALITNFHQPRSTHLLLVAAFFGDNNISSVYQYALENDFRFLSYGDSMLLEFSSGETGA